MSKNFQMVAVQSYLPLLAAVVLACIAAAAPADDDLDPLLGGKKKSQGSDLTLEDVKPVESKQFATRLVAATGRKDPGARRKELTELLDIYVQNQSVMLSPREAGAFTNAVLADVDPAALAARAPSLLRVPENIKFDLSAQARLNLGICLAMTAGGATFEQLKTVYDRCGETADLQWLLPAMARADGNMALPIIARYRDDASIIPLNNAQNIRRGPCAAVLAAAYAGDQDALEKVLAWYEQDYIDRPRFAFYVTWSIQQGMKPSYTLLDYCENRIAQAERLFDFRGAELLAPLIARANRGDSISLTDYLCRKLEAVPAGGLAAYLSLMEHPSVTVKQHVVHALLERGDAALRQTALKKLESLRSSPRGIDRLFAVETLITIDPARREAILAGAVEKETSDIVRRRLVALRDGAW